MKKEKKLLALILAVSLMLLMLTGASLTAGVGAEARTAVCTVEVSEQNAGTEDYFIAADVTFTSESEFTAGRFAVEAAGLELQDCTVLTCTGGEAPEIYVAPEKSMALFAGFSESSENDFRSYTALSLRLKLTVAGTDPVTDVTVKVKDINITNVDEEKYVTDDAQGTLSVQHTHTPSAEWEKDETNHWKVCTECAQQIDKAAHTFDTVVTDPTCTEGGYTTYTCTVCGYSYTADETTARGHSFTNYISNNDATCTADGTKTAKCDNCDETDTVTDVGSMLAHTVGEWITDAVSHHRHCEVCDEDVDVGEHAYQWVVVTPATMEADGLKKEVCSVCGYESGNEQNIPKLENHTPGDINGDGAVNNKDLTRLFQYLSDWDVQVDEAALDVNGDGNVNNKDLTRLFQFLSDWDVQIF